VDSNHWPHPPEALRSGRPAPVGADLRRATPGNPGENRRSPKHLVPRTVPHYFEDRVKIAGMVTAAKPQDGARHDAPGMGISPSARGVHHLLEPSLSSRSKYFRISDSGSGAPRLSEIHLIGSLATAAVETLSTDATSVAVRSGSTNQSERCSRWPQTGSGSISRRSSGGRSLAAPSFSAARVSAARAATISFAIPVAMELGSAEAVAAGRGGIQRRNPGSVAGSSPNLLWEPSAFPSA
jgi:hypothetical protein